MTPEVTEAIRQIRAAFPDNAVIDQDDGGGGAWVIVEAVDVGPIYTPSVTWIGFRITLQYPYADCYPHYVRSDLVRKDGKPLGDAISGGHTFQGRTAVQISRRSNKLNPETDTALIKLQKVLSWIRSRP
jgi:hypothetical protein